MLLAQSSASSLNSSFLALGILAGIAALAVFGLVVLVLLLRHLTRGRHLLHTERMRSIELGHPVEAPAAPDPNKQVAQFMHNAFWISFWLVVAVPGAAFSGANAATTGIGEQLALGLVIWLSAGAASVAAVVCATVLMISSRSRQFVRGGNAERFPNKPA